MSTEQPPLQYLSLFQAALALLTHDKQAASQSVFSALPKHPGRRDFDISTTLANLEAAFPGFEPLAPVDDDGLAFMPALLRYGVPARSTGWLDSWVQRHGVDSVFTVPAGDEGVITAWMRQHVIKDVIKGDNPSAEATSLATWLLQNAPDTVRDTLPVGEWTEILQSCGQRSTQALLSTLQDGRGGHESRRPMERWLATGTGALTEHTLVAGFSGRERTLSEFQHILHGRQRRDTQPDEDAPHTPLLHLVQPPHLRRDELIKHTLLNPAHSLDWRRAMLWRTSDLKLDIVMALIDGMEKAQARGQNKPGNAGQDLVQRGLELLTARDALGRGFIGFLYSGTASDPDVLHVHESIRRLGGAVADTAQEEALSTEGAGLIEQEIMGAAAEAHHKKGDAFSGRMRNAMKRTERNPGCVLGRDDRRAELIDFFIDACAAKTHHHPLEDMGAALIASTGDTEEQVKVEQALLLNRLLKFFSKTSSFEEFPGRSNLDAQRAAWLEYRSARGHTLLQDTFVEHVARHGLVLDMTEDDWRQLGLLGRERTRQKMANTTANKETQAEAFFERMDLIMSTHLQARALGQGLPTPDTSTARRPRM